MAELVIPDLGENIEQGDVVRVLVAKGDQIEADQPLLELETGKATVEVPAEEAGTVTEILVKEGQSIAVGAPAFIISPAGEAAGGTAKEPPAPAAVETPAEPPAPVQAPAQEAAPAAASQTAQGDFLVPDLGENIEEGEVINLHISVGDRVEVDQLVAELETGKATVDVPSSVSGVVKQLHVLEGGKARVGDPLFSYEGQIESGTVETPPQPADTAPVTPPVPAPARPVPAPVSVVPAPPSSSSVIPVRAAPSVRRFAREIGVDIHQVSPAVEGGRIGVEEVKAHAKKVLTEGPTAVPLAASGGFAPPPLPDFSKWGDIEEEPMSTIRKVTAQHMAACWNTIPHVTQQDDADITQLEAARKTFSKQVERAGGKLTLTAILLKIAGSALKAHPTFNASIDTARNTVIYKKYVHIGVAVDTPKGLLVPVIQDVDKKSITEICLELGELAGAAREGKIPPGSLQGGGFTISNLGGIGGTYFTPIVNHPEVAILGVGRGAMKPVYQDGEFVPRMIMPLSLSYDHRLIDGANGARFLRWIADACREPLLMSL